MEEVKELKQKVSQLTIIVNSLKQNFEDHFLSDKEKQLIDEAMKEKREGKLVDASNVL